MFGKLFGFAVGYFKGRTTDNFGSKCVNLHLSLAESFFSRILESEVSDSGRTSEPQVQIIMPSMKYIKSAVFPKDYPEADVPEVAVAGRSNAGKSTFLNGIAGGKVAKVSQVPGKTRLLNFFDFNSKYRFVDMPGYGFAARSGDEMHDWTQMIETYLSTRRTLKGLVLVMDVRREWSNDEKLLKKFCDKMNIPVCVVASKIDKCTQGEIAKLTAQLKKNAQTTAIFPISGLSKKGIQAVEDFIFQEWIKPDLENPDIDDEEGSHS